MLALDWLFKKEQPAPLCNCHRKKHLQLACVVHQLADRSKIGMQDLGKMAVEITDQLPAIYLQGFDRAANINLVYTLLIAYRHLKEQRG